MIIFLQIVSSIIPIIGIFVLLIKPQTNVSTKLLLANVGCFLLNIGYFWVVSAKGPDAALICYRIQYLGNVIFYTFFALFVISYLGFKIKPWYVMPWLIFEAIGFGGSWHEMSNFNMFNDIEAEIVKHEFGAFGTEMVYQITARMGLMSIIRNCIISMALFILIIITLIRCFVKRHSALRSNYVVLFFVETIVMTTLLMNILSPNLQNFTPIVATAAILVIVIKLINGEFITVADQAREWTFENMDNLVVITDSEFGYIDCNKAALEFFPQLETTYKNAPVPDIVKECLMRDGEDFVIDDKIVHIAVRALKGKKDEVDGYCLLLQNVTEDRAIREQLEIEKKNADAANKAKSTFLSNMSHEIRTPMNAIVGMTEILMRGKHTEEEKEYLSSIKSSGQALVAIINDILDYSKAESGKMELVNMPYDIISMLKDLRLMLLTRSATKPIELLFDVDEELPRYVNGDSLRLRQVIINIVNNAIKFTNQGFVKLIVRLEGIKDNNARIYFCVKDTGQGIKEEDLQKLFKSFSQVDTKRNRNVEGTGLGLAISKQLVELMGGDLSVSSVYGEGSEFFFTINLKICTEEEKAEVLRISNIEEAEENGTAEAFVAPEAKILIVDDNPMNLKVAKGLFAPMEMHIDTADSAAKAFEMLKEQQYDVIFMDHMMPVMDGVEATSVIRKNDDERTRNTVIIALTANVQTEAREEFEKAGVNDFTTKPINMIEVKEKLKKWLPAEKIKTKENIQKVDNHVETTEYPEGIDAAEGIKNSGTEELFLSLLSDFRKLIEVKANKMEKCLEDGMIKDYTIEMHALKSTARMIGAMELSEKAKEMEALGNAGDVAALKEKTPEVLKLYRSYKEKLSSFTENTAELNDITEDRFKALLEMMYHAAENFDTDTIDASMKELEESSIPSELNGHMDTLRVQVADLDTEGIQKTIDEMREVPWTSKTF
ncbi:MAG: ATP-binding protein [Lachnospiraceae bacterium]|nr:ATP-binding protein [Lachnospiraceae bacterium]